MTGAAAARSPETGRARREEVAARILDWAVALAVAGVLVQTAVNLVNLWAFDRRFEVLQADSDAGAFAWASIAATFAAALGALLLSLVWAERRRLLWLVAAGCAFLSFDDHMRIHERLGDLADRAEGLAAWEPARLLWPVVFFPLLAGLFLALWWLARDLPPPRAGRYVRTGLALLAVAVALEVVSAGLIRAGHDRGSGLYELEVLLEEGAELAGWILIAGALLAAFALDARPEPARMRTEGG
ncbi:MAG TPA: hypothetical protein VK915_15075 [Gaiellaceae bacterium]|nr:hypothetical protein [Gaiellaceae bacterium]